MKYLAILVGVSILFLSELIAKDFEDVVYLKNGEIVRGMIIEQVPNRSIKIQTYLGNIFVYQIDEIEKITKEELKRRKEKILISSNKLIGINFGNGFIGFPKDSGLWVSGLKKDIIGINTLKLYYSAPVTKNFYLSGACGLGMNHYSMEEDESSETVGKIELNISGFSSELEIFYSDYLNPLSNFKFFFGIDIGYYNYINNIKDGLHLFDAQGNPIIDEYKTKIYGFAQSFIFGFILDVSSKISANLKFQKLGVSFLTMKVEDKGSELFGFDDENYKEDIISSPDLENLGISIGISYKF